MLGEWVRHGIQTSVNYKPQQSEAYLQY